MIFKGHLVIINDSPFLTWDYFYGYVKPLSSFPIILKSMHLDS